MWGVHSRKENSVQTELVMVNHCRSVIVDRSKKKKKKKNKMLILNK